MMEIKNKENLKNLQRWINSKYINDNIKQEINKLSDEEKYDSFYKELDVGTAGIRGKIGYGTNRINEFIVRKISYFYGLYLKKINKNCMKISVVVGYDTRLKSKEFANVVSKTLQSLQIKVYIFPTYTQTPLVSYAIRKLKTNGGIMITASHNPYYYNGIKLYNNAGGQLTNDEGNEFSSLINDDFDYFKCINVINNEEIIAKQIYDDYFNEIKKLSILDPKIDKIKFIFSPLHGTGIEIASHLFNMLEYDYLITPSQNVVDPYFKTVETPNPEVFSAFSESLKLTRIYKSDLIICFDPDSDRLGAVVCDNDIDKFYHLSGNELGAIFLYYICKCKINFTDNNKLVFVTSIVSSTLTSLISEKYNIESRITLTGFKNINLEIERIISENKQFIFAYEESCGFLALDSIREKDAFEAAILLIEAASYFKNLNKTLLDVLNDIYNEFGYFVDKQINIIKEGQQGKKYIDNIIKLFKNSFLKKTKLSIYRYIDVFEKIDYNIITKENIELNYPREKVLKFYLDETSWFAIRPSGTEPKIKIYISCRGNNRIDAEKKIELIERDIEQIINGEMYETNN